MLTIASIHLKQIIPHILGYPGVKCLAEMKAIRGQETEVLGWRHDSVWHLLKIKCGQMLHGKQRTVESWLIADSVESRPVHLPQLLQAFPTLFLVDVEQAGT